ncbi:MAG TPA: T9SS type A sorting domain-containing protein, partial [Mariniflexile sp.]
YVSNVKSSTEVKIYAITGALVKEFKTNSNMDFVLKSGLYIATVKTAEGQKSVKLLLN